MRYLSIVIFFVLVLLPVTTVTASDDAGSPASAKNYVPDEETAIKIAEAVWLPLFGKDVLQKRPFSAKLVDGVWIVTGSLPEGMLGGVPRAEISKEDARILTVSHSQ